MNRKDFWNEVFALNGSVTPFIKGRVLGFTLFAVGVSIVAWLSHIETGLGVAPYEIIGVVLALLLMLRTNSGYDRWYEGRKLWGGIVNQTRNLGLIAVAQGPEDALWRSQIIRWTGAFGHACRHSLRDERDLEDMEALLGASDANQVAESQHMPMYVAMRLDQLLREAVDRGAMDRFAYLQAQEQRVLLIDHIGACERILRTPLAQAFSIKIRRFLFLYLVTLPLAIVDKSGWLTPVITLLVTYPLLSLDQIGIELQNPFSTRSLSHLPITQITENIQQDLLALLPEDAQARSLAVHDLVA